VDRDTVLVADRSQRGKLRFQGEQRAWFLHQILTQAFEDMEPGEARDAALLTAHGRMVGYLESLATQDSIYCHFEPNLKEILPDAIQRYVFATKVEIEDVTGEFGLVLLAGDGWRKLAEEKVPVPRIHETRSLGMPAGYVWLDRVYVADVLSDLEQSGGVPVNEEELDAIRIENGIPRWGYEMDSKTIPQEAGIDRWAVHYDKGCYVGQEAMAKIHFRGKVNRKLVRLETQGLVQPGTDLSVGEKRVGTVTSVSNGKALAMVNRLVDTGTELIAGDAKALVVA
jgi:folate-binding protein YgfZ